MNKLNRFFTGLGILCAMSFGLQAQTVLINPATEGGFELPGGFAGNGWTVENGTAVNQWHLGALALPSMTGNVAYISNDAGVSNAYTTSLTTPATAISVVHLYRDVTFPAGEAATLSFDLSVRGEATWDELLVSVAETTTALPPSTTSLSNGPMPAPFITLGRYNLLTGTQRITISIPFSALNNCLAPSTRRIIFTWKNDNGGGVQPPAAIDNIQLISQASPVTLGLPTYTINNTMATGAANFNNFADAITWLNALHACNSILGPITFNVSAGQTFVHTPLFLTASGTAANQIIFQKSGMGANPIIRGTGGTISGTNGDAILSLIGSDYITLRGLDFEDDPASTTDVLRMEYGLRIVALTATDGARHNTFENLRFTLSNANNSTRGIMMSAATSPGSGIVPTASTGANSFNVFRGIEVITAFGGFHFLGNGTHFDEETLIENCTIGTTTANSIGGTAASATSGIRLTNQSNVIVRNSIVQNVSAATTVEGILVTLGRGLTQIHNNQVLNVSNVSATSTGFTCGIRVELATGIHSSRIYNNFVANVNTLYTGGATATRIVKGIFLATGGSSGSVYDVDFNSVNLVTTSLTASSAAFEIGSNTTYTVNARNNVFVNASPNRSSTTASHVAIYSPSATSYGGAGSVVNNNAYWVPNTTTGGHIGRGSTTNFTTLAALRTAYGQDAASIVADPLFVSLTDLHASSAALDGTANMTGITWVVDDIDGDTRVAPHDIGADDFTPASLDVSAIGFIQPTSACFDPAAPVVVRLSNVGVQPLDFAANNVTVTVNVTGAATQTLSFTVNNNTLNAGQPLATGQTIDVTVGTVNMSAAGTYNFDGSLSLVGDGNMANNTFPTRSLTSIAPVAGPLTVNFTGFTGSNLPTVFPGWVEGVGNPPAVQNALWSSRTTLPGAGTTAAINYFGTGIRNEWILSPLFAVATGMVLNFDVAITDWDNANPSNSGPGLDAIDTFRIMVSTDCGVSYTPLATYTRANTASWTNALARQTISLNSFAGSNVIIGFHAVSLGGGSRDYDLHLDNINIAVPPAVDAGVTAFLTPGAANCFSSSEVVSVRVQNFGTNSLSNIPVTVQVTGAVTQTLNQVIPGPLAAGASTDLSFTATVDMTAPGTYNFSAYTGIAGDAVAANDTFPLVTRTVVAPATAPLAVDFTGFTGANLTTVFPGWFEATGSNRAVANANWVNRSVIPGAGVTAAINFWSLASRNDWIVSPLFLMPTNASLSFDLAVTAFNSALTTAGGLETRDTFRVWISTDCGLSFTVLQEYNNSNTGASLTNQLRTERFNLAAFAGSNAIIAFQAVSVGQTGTRDYDLHLDNINICSAPMASTIAAVSPVCQGQPATLNVTAPVTGFTYAWFDAANGGTNLGTGTSLSVTPTATTTYYLETRDGACTALSRTLSTVTVNDLPSAPVAADVSRCGTGIVSLTATAAPGIGLEWFDALGNSLTPGPNYTTPTINSTRVYTVVAINPSTGCTSIPTTVSAIVNQLPSAPTAPDATACQNATANLVVTSLAPTGVDFQWSDDNAPSATILATGAAFNVTATTSMTYYVRSIETATGCFSAFVPVELTVNPTPATPSITGGNTTECEGITVNLSASGSTGTYTWYDAPTGGTVLSTGASFMASFTPTNPLLIYVEAEDNGCVSARAMTSLTIETIPSLNLLTSVANICLGDTTELQTNPNLGVVSWFDVATGGTALATGANLRVSPAMNMNYYAEVANGSCISAREMITVNVTSVPSPVINLTPAQLVVCQNPSPLVVGVQTGAAGTTYTWSNTAGVVSTQNTLSVDASTAGVFNFSVLAQNNGCSSAPTTFIVTVNALPNTGFSYDSTSYCVGGSVANPLPTITGDAGGTFSADNGLSINAMTGLIDLATAVAGTYEVTYTIAGTCTNSSTFTLNLVTCSSVETLAAGQGYSLFPNPNQGQFTIKTLGQDHMADVQVIDVLGKVVYSRFELPMSSYGVQLQLPSLVPGTYFVRVIQGERAETLPLIIK